MAQKLERMVLVSFCRAMCSECFYGVDFFICQIVTIIHNAKLMMLTFVVRNIPVAVGGFALYILVESA